MAIPQIHLPRGHLYRYGEDSARYLLDPGDEFRRPWLRIPNGPRFVWPVGTEQFSYESNANLGIHRYIGKADIEVNVIYRDEPRITMQGTFPGRTGATTMRALLAILEARTPAAGKILFLPYVFPRVQFVAAENWSFEHEGADRTRSLGYQISFLLVGTGSIINIPQPEPPEGEQPPPTPPATRTFRVKDRYRRLRGISKLVYKNEKKWIRLYNINKVKLDKHFKKHHIPRHKYPTTMLPLGMTLKY